MVTKGKNIKRELLVTGWKPIPIVIIGTAWYVIWGNIFTLLLIFHTATAININIVVIIVTANVCNVDTSDGNTIMYINNDILAIGNNNTNTSLIKDLYNFFTCFIFSCTLMNSLETP